uniref:Major facilitator superfamily (MFS) profile domain-containing protein n=1 Tax=Ditylenchus dipsaci TaxID=166011 RepID=A0A915D7X2_9BILA
MSCKTSTSFSNQLEVTAITRNIFFLFFRLGNLVPDYNCLDENFNWTLTASEVKKNTTLACALVQKCFNLTTTSHWLMQSLLPIGSLVAFLCSGHLSDMFGRKWLIIMGNGYSIVSGLACSLSPSFSVYLWLTAVGAFISPISGSACFSLIVESVNPKYRLIQGFSFQFSVGLMLAGGLATLCHAAVVLTSIAKFNGHPNKIFTAEDVKAVHERSKCLQNTRIVDTKKYTCLDLFANWKMTSYVLAQVVNGIALNIVNDVLFFNIQDLSGSPFMNTFLMEPFGFGHPFLGLL